MALKRHKHHIGNRYIEVYRATGEDFLAIAGGASNEAQAFLSKGAQVIIRMRGLPYDCTAKQVLDFFTTGEKPCDVLDGVEGVLFVKKPDGRATGDAFVLFANEADAPNALSRHRESIGQRYIELFRSTTAEVQQVLNRSMDPKTYEQNHQPPLIAQLPAVLLPQHLITSGTTKNCIRLRGLPYEALVEHILHFLDDFAKHIIYQGVHMVINAQGQPSGEAFIQMDSEESARTCAQRKHNQFMVFGKKYRYIEVFQCSGDDMNMVLNGGLQSPVSAHHVHLPGAAKQPPLLSPGAPLIGSAFCGHFAPFGPPTPLLGSPHHHHQQHPHHPTPHPHPAAFYPAPLVYWPYPSPPVSPTTYFSQPTNSPPHMAAASQHQPLYPVEFMPAATAANNFAAAAPPNAMSPPALAIPTAPAAATGLLLTPTPTPTPKTHTLPLMAPPKQFPSLLAPSSAPTRTIAPPVATVTVCPNKMPPQHHQQQPLSPTPTPTPTTTPTPTQASNTYLHSNYSNNNEGQSVPSMASPTRPSPIRSLLTIDTSHDNNERMVKPAKGHATPDAATTPTNATNNRVTNNLVAETSGQTLVKPNQRVELYIS